MLPQPFHYILIRGERKLKLIYIKSPFVIVIRCSLIVHPSIHHIFLRGNNSAVGGHRALPKVANERYCNIVLIFCIFCAHVHMHAAHMCCACMLMCTNKNSKNKNYCNTFYLPPSGMPSYHPELSFFWYAPSMCTCTAHTAYACAQKN